MHKGSHSYLLLKTMVVALEVGLELGLLCDLYNVFAHVLYEKVDNTLTFPPTLQK